MKMFRKISFVSLSGLYLFIFLITGFTEEKKIKIAVFDLGVTSTDVSQSEGITLSEYIRSILIKTGSENDYFDVISRDKLIKISEQYKFKMTGLTEGSHAIRLAKILDVKNAITGNIGKVGSTYVINIQLLDLETDKYITAESIEADNMDDALTKINEKINIISRQIELGDDYITGLIGMYPPKSGPDWLAKIDDYLITGMDFDEGYKYLLSQVPEEKRTNLPPDTKKKYFNSLISQYLINIKALNDGLLKIPGNYTRIKKYIMSVKAKSGLKNTPANQPVLRNYIRQAIAQIYIQSRLPADKNFFKPSKGEIDDFYLKNKTELDNSGLKSGQMKQVITQEIERQKQQEWLQKYLDQIKENFKIQINEAALLQEGISE